MRNLTVAAGVEIFAEGDSADCAYLVEEGWVEIFVDRQGSRHLLSLIGPGEIFGEMGVIDGSPRSASAVAAEQCRLLRITVEQFQALLGRTEPFHAELLTKVVSRFRNAQKWFLDGGAEPRLETADMGPGYAMLSAHRDLAHALDRGEIEPFLQPVVDLASGRWCGFEALARWRCPQRGIVPPVEFLPLAERTGLIRRIDFSMAEQAMRLCRSLAGDAAPYVNVNFSAWHFRDGDLVSRLNEMLQRTGMSAGCLRLELTESMMLDDPDGALRVMTGLADMGFKLALDDFGTGYSSLSVLHRMPIHVLKIDRSLIVGVLQPGRSRTILSNVLALARDLGMDVVAEGVEDRETVDALRDLGCQAAQGYLFARPMPAEEALAAWQSQARVPI